MQCSRCFGCIKERQSWGCSIFSIAMPGMCWRRQTSFRPEKSNTNTSRCSWSLEFPVAMSNQSELITKIHRTPLWPPFHVCPFTYRLPRSHRPFRTNMTTLLPMIRSISCLYSVYPPRRSCAMWNVNEPWAAKILKSGIDVSTEGEHLENTWHIFDKFVGTMDTSSTRRLLGGKFYYDDTTHWLRRTAYMAISDETWTHRIPLDTPLKDDAGGPLGFFLSHLLTFWPWNR